MCTVCYCNMLYRYTYICVHVYIHICMYIYTGHMCPVCYCSVYTHIYIYIYIYICTTHLYIYVQHSCEECIAPPKICNAGRLLEQSIHIYIHIYVYIYIYMYLYIYGANMHYTSSMLYNHCSKSCSRSLKSAQCTFETPGVVSYMSCVHGSLSNAKTPPLGG